MADDLASAREYAVQSSSLWSAHGPKVNAVYVRLNLGEAEFRAGNIERAITLAEQTVAAARSQGHERFLRGQLVNLSAYLIAAGRWDEARAAAREAVALDREVQRFCELQHLAAVTVLSATAAADDLPSIRDAALVVGYVDGCVDARGEPREYTEAQEYDRVRTVLGSILAAEELAMLLEQGAALTHNDAVRIAMSC